MKYQLTDRYYIRKLDSKNWIFCRTDVSKKTKLPYEKILGYSATLKVAWNLAIDEVTLMPDSNQELLQVIERIEKLKVDTHIK